MGMKLFFWAPNWWNTILTPMFNFLGHYDWRGKRIIPFVTSGGSGLGKSVEDMKKLCMGELFVITGKIIT